MQIKGRPLNGEEPTTSSTLHFFVNGIEVKDSEVNPQWTLLYYLRSKLGLRGTKLGCAEGGCGACTVMVSRYDRKNGKIVHVAANACLTPVCAMHGLAVTTVEGIGSTNTKLHPVQERIAKAHGSQCGFCTPGIVMSMYSLLRAKPKPNMDDMEVALQGNLCRCTGYRPIIEGFKTFTEEWEEIQRLSGQANGCSKAKNCGMGDSCCQKAFTSEPQEVFNSKEFLPYDPTQEPIFPPPLMLSNACDEEYLVFKGKEATWYRPTNLQELLTLKEQYPNAKIIVGNTEVGVEVKFKHFSYPVLIQPTNVTEMKITKELNDGMLIGASVTLVEMEMALLEQMSQLSGHKTRIYSSIVDMMHWFAGKQIRNVAAVGGNIMTGSPISDLNPIFMASGINLNLSSLSKGDRTIPMNHEFFTGYRRNVVAQDEILVSIEIPHTLPNQYFVSYKQAKRRDDDIAIVNIALNVFFEPGTSVVQKAFMAFGGMAPTTVLARKTCEAMIGRKWNSDIVETVIDYLVNELPLSGDAPGGMVLYRRSLTLSLFFKSFIRIQRQLQKDNVPVEPIPKHLETAGDEFIYTPPKSSQYFQEVPKDQSPIDLIGRPIIHSSALKQAAGEAVYCDDMPRIEGELYFAFVLSTKAHAKILSIDPSAALAVEGVIAFFDANDIPDKQRYVGAVIRDEEVFVSKVVTSQGQPIGGVVAEDQATAQKAARLVKIEYEDISPVIVTIEDAIEANSYFEEHGMTMVTGDVDKAFAESDHVLEGEVRMGGQEHFYLETQCAIAVPKEKDEMEVFSSTQHPSEIQELLGVVLDVPINMINVRVKRMGGGFGGKQSRGILVALPIAFAANKLKRPVRCMLDRDEDMLMTGTRHPYLSKYKVGFNNEGKINVIDIHLYANSGYSIDHSPPVLEKAMHHYENAYRVPVSRVEGHLCKTNLPSNTAFRGFGGPQGMFAGETIIRHIADYLKRDVIELSELNLYKEGDITHYDQKLLHCNAKRCWDECLTSSNCKERMVQIQQFNKENRYRKRGMSIIPTKFSIGFTPLLMNQAGALVHVYVDGSVLISHGGTEMGQGLNVKMIQVASRVLKVHPEKIHIMETATDKVPNTMPTAASSGSDLNGMAVLNACEKIMRRLQPIMDLNPNKTWEQWIRAAYVERIGLSATGFYATPDMGSPEDNDSGNLYNYFTYGAACSEVEIDCLTGDHQVLRSDVIMDLGESLNPAIDIGQVEGGFVQGYGLFTLEEMVYSPTGIVFSRGPGAYKIPSFTNIPQEFNVSILKGVSNPRAVYSSKAVGEPPLFLASTVFFAIKEAIKAARQDMNLTDYFRFDSPATSARIRMACVDTFTQKIGDGDGKKAWNVYA